MQFCLSLAVTIGCAYPGLCDNPPNAPKIIRAVLSWSDLNRFSDGGARGPKAQVLLVTDAKTFAKIWHNLKLPREVPQVNFEDYFVLAVTKPLGLDLSLPWGGLALDDKGRATIRGSDVHADDMNSRFHSSTLAIFPRSGIQTVEGMKLPAA